MTEQTALVLADRYAVYLCSRRSCPTAPRLESHAQAVSWVLQREGIYADFGMPIRKRPSGIHSWCDTYLHLHYYYIYYDVREESGLRYDTYLRSALLYNIDVRFEDSREELLTHPSGST